MQLLIREGWGGARDPAFLESPGDAMLLAAGAARGERTGEEVLVLVLLQTGRGAPVGPFLPSTTAWGQNSLRPCRPTDQSPSLLVRLLETARLSWSTELSLAPRPGAIFSGKWITGANCRPAQEYFRWLKYKGSVAGLVPKKGFDRHWHHQSGLRA